MRFPLKYDIILLISFAIAIILTLNHPTIAAIWTYLSKFGSGELSPGWPHFWLLFISVVASFAVGAGIIFEGSKYSESVHRIAFWLVIGGIAVEALCTIFLFVFDEGISSAQQSTIISLEQLSLPRRVLMSIHKDQAYVYTDMGKYRGTTVLMQIVPDDWETKHLAVDIYEVLTGSGFIVRDVKPSETGLYPTEISDGVTVHIRNGATLSPSKVNTGISAGMAIANWLKETRVNPTGIPVWGDIVRTNPVTKRLVIDSPDDVVLVTVGLKPAAATLRQPWLDMQDENPNNPYIK